MSWYPSHVQSWTKIPNEYQASALAEKGHTIYVRGDGKHHDTGICQKCREQSAARIEEHPALRAGGIA